jgi:hypothetical protein
MKKQIAVLITIVIAAVHGFVAFGQDWITVQESGNNVVWDDFGTPGSEHLATAGVVNLEVLWAPLGVIDPLPGIATTGDPDPPMPSSITSMLSNGWNLLTDHNSGSGTAALGTVETTTGGTISKGGSIVAFNGGNPFEFLQTQTFTSGESIQVVWLGFNASASSYLSAGSLGVSSDSTVTVGTTEADPNATAQEEAPPFGVVTLPEPTTLALVGLGGLATFALRRRKA